MIAVRYFARVREALGREGESVAMPQEACRVEDLVEALRGRDPAGWGRLPEDMPLLYAVNHQMAPETTEIHDGDEVAVFPPVTGG